MKPYQQSKSKEGKLRHCSEYQNKRKSKSKFLQPYGLKNPIKSSDKKISNQKSIQIKNNGKNRKNNPPEKNLHSHHQYYNKYPEEMPTTEMISEEYGTYQLKAKSLHKDKDKKSQALPKSFSIGDLNPKYPQFKFPQSKGVINFDGKFVKAVAIKKQTSKKKNFTTYSQSQINFSENEIPHKTKKKINKKSISKSKQKNKESEVLEQIKMINKMQLRKTMGRQERQFIRKALLTDDTQISPNHRIEYERNQFFDLTQMQSMIEEELNDKKQPICLDPSLQEMRHDCFKMISRFSGLLQVRRQSFFLALQLFDRTLDANLQIINRNYKLLALVCLMLSLKLEEAQLAIELVYVLKLLLSGNGKQKNMSSRSLTKRSVPKKSMEGEIKKNQKKYVYLHKENRIKIDLVSQILNEEKCSKTIMSEILQLQFEIIFKLEFKIWKNKLVFWADLLTCFWDQYILNEKGDSETNLLFRSPFACKNLAYTYQILELAHLSMRVHLYQPVYIVLSIMFLLLRISMERQINGFEMYRTALAKSTGILFVDKNGLNEIYWNFLLKLKIEMGDILGCCQFVSQFLQFPKLNKELLDSSFQNFDQGACVHTFSPHLYNSIWK